MSEQLDTLTLRPVHPASPVLLTKNGLLRTSIRSLSTIKFEKAPCFTFTSLWGFKHPKTRTYVRFLGPCFKTGQIRLFRHDRETVDHVKHCTLVDTATHTVCSSATSSKPPNATISAYQSSISVALGLGASFEDRTQYKSTVTLENARYIQRAIHAFRRFYHSLRRN
jgi:hypothetical protein